MSFSPAHHPIRRVFIINSSTGKRFGKQKQLDDWRRRVESHGGEFLYFCPQGREETITLAQDLVQDGVEEMVVVGGDGTINTVVNGLLRAPQELSSQVTLVLTAMGSGNDYVKSFMRANQRKNFWDWWSVGNYRKVAVDAVKLSYHDPKQGHQVLYWMNECSLGVFSQVVKTREELSWNLKGELSYLLPAMLSFSLPRRLPLNVEINRQETWTLKDCYGMFIRKGAYCGGNFHLGENLYLSSQNFQILWIKEGISHGAMLYGLAKALASTVESSADMVTHVASHLKLTSSESIQLEMDGVVLPPMHECEMEIIPGAFHVAVPD